MKNFVSVRLKHPAAGLRDVCDDQAVFVRHASENAKYLTVVTSYSVIC